MVLGALTGPSKLTARRPIPSAFQSIDFCLPATIAAFSLSHIRRSMMLSKIPGLPHMLLPFKSRLFILSDVPCYSCNCTMPPTVAIGLMPSS